ncbi:nuclear transport factor 2 family protein [Acidobacteriota bacterium]
MNISIRKISKGSTFVALSILMLFMFGNLGAQTSEETAIKNAVQTFFDSIAEKSAKTASSVLNKDGFIFEAKDSDNNVSVAITSFQDFIKKLPSFSGELLEQMQNPKIMIHGNIAVVWTPFTFHKNGEYSHSGLDTFQLIKTNEGWKIFSILYTADRK